MSAHRISDIYTLSPAQEGMLFHTLYEGASDVYHDQVVGGFHVAGGFDDLAFERACREVVARHAALRTVFSWKRRERPLQVVLDRVEVPLQREDWRGLPEGEQRQRLADLLRRDRERPFDLARPPLIRLALVRLSDRELRLVLSYHHVVLDVWSVQVVFQEAFALYVATVAGRAATLPAARPYRDFIAWLRQQDAAAAETHWRAALAGFRAPTRLGGASGPRAQEASAGQGWEDREARLSAAETETLNAFARRHRLTPSTVVQGAWALLLGRWSGEEDVVFGTSLAGRPAGLEGVERMVGLFLNVLPVRARIDGSRPAAEWLRELQQGLAGMRRHEHTPLSQVQAWSELPRGVALFESLFSYENVPGVGEEARWEEAGIQGNGGEYFFRTNYPLNGMAVPGSRLLLRVVADRGRLEPAATARLLGHLAALLTALPAAPERPLASLPWLSEAERHQVLAAWNDTDAPHPGGCIHELVERTVDRWPDSVAVATRDEHLSYLELDRRANRLAHHLRALGVGSEVLVGLCVERSLEMVVGILGILKAGGAYLPLDPAYPRDRLAWMLEDTAAPVLVTQARCLPALPPHDAHPVCLDADWPAIAGHGDGRPAGPAAHPAADNPAYLIYTSGSTGRPKGVVLLHRGLVDLIPDWNRAFDVRFGDRVLQFASFSFDASVWETFSALVAGATLCFGSRQTLYSGEELMAMLRDQQITRALLPPSLLAVLSGDGLPALEVLAAIGEKCTDEVVARWASPRRLFNAYGPAETTITVALHRIAGPGSHPLGPPIGRPMENTRLFVLDRHLEPFPVGVPGELCVAGERLARGYLHSPDLTAAKFVPCPFTGVPGDRLYRTGDLARLLPDGNVEFLGRADHQVKIRGFRVEVGEVEAALKQHPAVRQAVVVARETGRHAGEVRLVAYVVAEPGSSLSQAAVRGFLRQQLPDHMLPSALMLLEALPISPNGKVDRKALPAPDWGRPEGETGFVAPRTPEEELLARIWAQVLGVARVGVQDNFFDLGGDSILSIQIIGKASQEGLYFTPRQLFEHQTVAGLAAVAARALPGVEAAPADSGPVPLTPAQRWFLEQEIADRQHFNQALLLSSEPPLDGAILDRAISWLRDRHEALRLRFQGDDAEWRQVIAAAGGAPPLTRIDLRGLPPAAAEMALAASAEAVQGSLDLSRGPLFRTVLFERGAAPALLLLTAHHLVVDGASWRILLADLEEACEAFARGRAPERPLPPVPFHRWAKWLAERARSGAVRDELALWLGQPWERARRLPLDFPAVRSGNLRGAARTVTGSLTPEETAALLREAGRGGGRAEEILLTALAVAFGRWLGWGALLVDLERHGREPLDDLDGSGTVGWLTAFCPILLDIGGAGGASAPAGALEAVRHRLRAIPDGGIGYGLLGQLGPADARESLRRLPRAEVSFNYFGRLDLLLPRTSRFRLLAGPVGSLRSPRGRRSYLLEIDAMVWQGELVSTWTYAAGMHRRETVERLAAGFAEALHELEELLALPGEERRYTPADFPEVALDQGKLDRALAEMGLDGGGL